MDPIYDGYVELACTIAEGRSERYRYAYLEWLKSTRSYRYTESASKYSWGSVLRFERKLKTPPTNLTDDQITSLQCIVEKTPEAAGIKDSIIGILEAKRRYNLKEEKPRTDIELIREVSKATNVPEKILLRWSKARELEELAKKHPV